MKHPGEGRPFKKDITYTEPAKNVKDCKMIGKSLPKTSGIEAVVSTPAPVRPYNCG